MGKFSRKVRRSQGQDQRKADHKKLRDMHREAVTSSWKKQLRAKEARERDEVEEKKPEEPTEGAT